MTEKELEQVENMLIEYWSEYYGEDRAKAFKEFLDDRDRKTAEQIKDFCLNQIIQTRTNKDKTVNSADHSHNQALRDVIKFIDKEYLKDD